MASGLRNHPLIGVITNPNSKKNRRRHDRVAELESIVGRHGVVRQTASTVAIPGVIREFLDLGVDYWVSDGGDGALHWMLNTAHDVIEARHSAGGRLDRHLRYALPTNGGTIDYVARKAGVRGQAEEILKKLVLLHEKGETIEESVVPSMRFLGVQELPDGTVRRFERIGFAAAVAGVGNRFFEKYYLARVPGPKVICEVIAKVSGSYVLGASPLARFAPREWLAYGEQVLAPMPARVTIEGRVLPQKQFTSIACGAFKINLGGTLKLFPLARPGLLHLTAGDPDPLTMIANLPRMASGRRLNAKGLHDGAGREMRVEATTDELLRPNIDGEFVHHVRELTVRPGPRFRIPRIDAKA